ncbi:MAG: hypothetical protein KDE14_13850 [Rhodobacteraceae bacterium]|nr:hypothetical protein [Paracoccaceae bacterium]
MNLRFLFLALPLAVFTPRLLLAEQEATFDPLPGKEFKFYEAGDVDTIYLLGNVYVSDREAKFQRLNGSLQLSAGPIVPQWMKEEDPHEWAVIYKVNNTEDFAAANPTFHCTMKWLLIDFPTEERWNGVGWFGSKEEKDLDLYMNITIYEGEDITDPRWEVHSPCYGGVYVYYVPLADYPLLRERAPDSQPN